MANRVCEKCIHYDVCLLHEDNFIDDVAKNGFCGKFKNKADVVEVETIKAWLYEMAINNVGCDRDFSKACEEIISRLDGLRNFAKERSEGDGKVY